MPKVSVIIPVYGVDKYIERCARSLFEQTLDDIEYLFIDDCTPDKSIEKLKLVLEEYPNRKNQVVIYHMNNNSGQAAVREWGIKHASGQYVIHCDSDDWVDKNMYKEMYDLAIEEQSDLVVCDYYCTDEKHYIYKIGCHNREIKHFFYGLLTQKENGALWNKLFRRDVLLKELIWPKGDMGEDMLLNLQLVYNVVHMSYVSKGFYFYYYNPQSITASNSKEAILHRFEQSVKNATELVSFFKEKGIYVKYRYEIERMLYSKKNLLRPLILEKNYYTMWKNTFPELNSRILINPYVSFAIKLKHFCLLLKAINVH